jgi:hypothetical protein
MPLQRRDRISFSRTARTGRGIRQFTSQADPSSTTVSCFPHAWRHEVPNRLMVDAPVSSQAIGEITENRAFDCRAATLECAELAPAFGQAACCCRLPLSLPMNGFRPLARAWAESDFASCLGKAAASRSHS